MWMPYLTSTFGINDDRQFSAGRRRVWMRVVHFATAKRQAD